MSLPSSPALAGVRVLDLTHVLSGPFCTQILGDLGADVIKVESPEGDLARRMPPHFVGEDSVYFTAVNRNKRSLVVDMKAEGGLDVVRELVLASDVVVENYRPGVLDRLGLSAAALRAEKPALVWCSITGFGQTGPYRDKPAFDLIVQAMSGGMSLTGEIGGPAVRAGLPIADLTAGIFAAVGVLAALHRRETTGRGDHLDIGMLDCQAALLGYQAAFYMHSGIVPGRQGSGHDSFATYRPFMAKDGIEVLVAAMTEKMWAGLCRVLGLEALIADPRFATAADRLANKLALWPLLQAAFLERESGELVSRLEAESIPVALVNTVDRVVTDPHILARGLVLDLAAEDGRRVRVMGDPLAMAEARRAGHSYPPAAGEHSAEVLRDVLGVGPDTIDRLVQAGAVRLRKQPTAQET